MTDTPIPGYMRADLAGSGSLSGEVSAGASLAQGWFHDAVAASKSSDPDARRHEVVFSVMFAEAWLYEWVRDVIVPAPPVVIERDVFHKKVRLMPLRKRWAEVTESLFGFRLTTAASVGPNAVGLEQLINLRNALVHADTSRQYPVHPPDGKTYGDVVELHPGWALRAAVEQAETLLTITKPSDQARWPGWLAPR